MPFQQKQKGVALANADDYVGLYTTETGREFRVKITSGDVMLYPANQLPLRMIPTSDLEFVVKALNTSITLERDENGSVTALTISQAGEKMRAAKRS